jgi:hypothetical protein
VKREVQIFLRVCENPNGFLKCHFWCQKSQKKILTVILFFKRSLQTISSLRHRVWLCESFCLVRCTGDRKRSSPPHRSFPTGSPTRTDFRWKKRTSNCRQALLGACGSSGHQQFFVWRGFEQCDFLYGVTQVDFDPESDFDPKTDIDPESGLDPVSERDQEEKSIWGQKQQEIEKKLTTIIQLSLFNFRPNLTFLWIMSFQICDLTKE